MSYQLTLLLGLPLAAIVPVWLVEQPSLGRRLSLTLLGAALLLSLSLFLRFDPRQSGLQFIEPSVSHSVLALDGWSVALLPHTLLVTLCLLLAAPRNDLSKREWTVLLSTTSMTLGTLMSLELLAFASFWTLSLLPGLLLLEHPEQRGRPTRVRGVMRWLFVISVAPLWIVVAVVTALGAHHVDLRGVSGDLDLPHAVQLPLLVLLLISVTARSAVAPFHRWLPSLIEHGPHGLGLFFLAVPVGMHPIVRLVFPIFPEANQLCLPLLTAIGMVTVLHGALLAMVQTELRRTLAFLGVSQWGLVLVGLQSMNLQSVAGAALQITVHGLTLAGLGLLTRSLEIRTGSSEHARLGGLSQASPRMAVLFLLLGCANVGFPPTLGFVGEDLLLHGMLGVHPILAVGLLLATVLNGITVMMAFKRVFLGPWRKELGPPETVRDLLPRERFAVLALALVVCLGGIYPRYLLSVRQHAIETLVTHDVHASH